MISQTFIQNLLDHVNIIDIVSRYVVLKKNSANYIGLCPFHNEKSPSFTVNLAKQFYYCFGCGAHGTIINFLIKYLGMSFIEVVKGLAQNAGMVLPDSNNCVLSVRVVRQQQVEVSLLLNLMKLVCDFYRHRLRETPHAITYLKNRGLTGEIAAKFLLGFAPENWNTLCKLFSNYDLKILVSAGLVVRIENKNDSVNVNQKSYDRFRGRIIFPIRDINGQIIGFGGRVLDNQQPKYLNSPETILFHKRRELYGLFEARQAIHKAGYVLVTEGYMDVIALAQSGFAHVVATLGTSCTAFHVQQLFRHTDQIVFSFDGDVAGQFAARRVLDVCLKYVSDTKNVKFLFLPFQHDPDSYVRKFGIFSFFNEVKNALPLSQFLIQEVIRTNDLGTPEGRARVQFNAKKMIQLLPQSFFRMQIARAFAQQVHVATQEIEESTATLGSCLPRTSSFCVKKSSRVPQLNLEQQIARLLIVHPALAADLDEHTLRAIQCLSSNLGFCLIQLIKICLKIKDQRASVDVMKYLCDTHANINFQDLIIRDAIDFESGFEISKKEIAGAIKQIKIRWVEFKMKKLIFNGLKDQKERNCYRALMQQKEHLKYILSDICNS